MQAWREAWSARRRSDAAEPVTVPPRRWSIARRPAYASPPRRSLHGRKKKLNDHNLISDTNETDGDRLSAHKRDGIK
ncbi:hypothetical protein RR46_08664 [Papilio xuthus]|uniref:Uncharacterized protein n=1 Tax=Papilio xuthus TaxID=66420 RepID=A0A194Q7W2_PAPXU|nr:hypothetical protein RR46_08664 [Papilio xuthus]